MNQIKDISIFFNRIRKIMNQIKHMDETFQSNKENHESNKTHE